MCFKIGFLFAVRDFFQAGDFGQDGGGFVLQGRFQRRVVGVGDLAGFVFEVEIAQVFVDGVFALAQIAGAGFLRTEEEPSGQVENIEEAGGEHQRKAADQSRS